MLNEQQKAARSKGIGGSEAGIVCGLSPWRTPVQLWMEKTGRVPAENLDDKEVVRWGHLLEDVVADEWALREGKKVHRVNDTLVSRHHDWMLANIDRRIVGLREGLEVKTASAWTEKNWGESGTDDVPLFYLTQAVHYQHVLDYDAWNFGVLLGGNELRRYRVTRDRDSEGRLIELEAKFWRCVETDTPPRPINTDDLVRLYPKTHGAIRATEDVALLVHECAQLAEQRKQIEKAEKELKLRIGEYMGEAGDLIDPIDVMVTIATYRSNDVQRVDVKRVRSNMADDVAALLRAAGGHPDYAEEKYEIATLGEDGIAKRLVEGYIATNSERRFLVK